MRSRASYAPPCCAEDCLFLQINTIRRLTFGGNPLSPTGRRPKGLFSNDEASGATRTAKVTFAGNSAGGDGAGGTAVRS